MPTLRERLRAPERAERPAAHLGLVWRRLGAEDLPAAADLAARCTEADQPVHPLDVAPLAALVGPSPAMPSDTLGGFGPDGRLEAMAVVYLPPDATDVLRAFLVATIAPTWRGRGIGRALLDWQDARARQLLAADGRELPVRIAAHVDAHLADRRRLYVAAGFSPKRTFDTLRRSLAGPLPAVHPPEGLRLVTLADADDPRTEEALRVAHNEAFTENWGTWPLGPETWRVAQATRTPEWSVLALDTGGAVAGYALTARPPGAGGLAGHTDLLGVLPAWRGRGAGRALLSASLAAMAAGGAEAATLDVDSRHPGTAPQLYRSLGYERVGARVLYTLEV